MSALDKFPDGSIVILDYFKGLLSGMEFVGEKPVIRTRPHERLYENNVRINLVSTENEPDNATLGREARVMTLEIVTVTKEKRNVDPIAERGALSRQVEELMAGDPANCGVHQVADAQVEAEWEITEFDQTDDLETNLFASSITYSILYGIRPGVPGTLI